MTTENVPLFEQPPQFSFQLFRCEVYFISFHFVLEINAIQVQCNKVYVAGGWNNDFVKFKERRQRPETDDSNLQRQAVANYLVIRPSVSRVIRIIVGASVEINLYQFTTALVHSSGRGRTGFLAGDKSSSTDPFNGRGTVVLVEVQSLWKPRAFLCKYKVSKYLGAVSRFCWRRRCLDETSSIPIAFVNFRHAMKR